MAEHLLNSENFIQDNPGKGPVVAATSVTSPEVQPYVTIESLLGNFSITLKGDSSEPFSGLLFSFLSFEFDLYLPIQFITYDYKKTRKRYVCSQII